MRLGTCIALELAIAAGAASGVWLGASRGVGLAGDYLRAREAIAAAPPVAAPVAAPPPAAAVIVSVSAVGPLPPARLVAAPASPETVFGAPDEELLAPLAATPLAKVKLNHGGTTLSLRLDFESGARAAFKPQQTHVQSDPRREIAAYRIDRLLGIGHVAPAKSAVFSVDDMVDAVESSSRAFTAGRIEAEGIAHNGKLCGEVQWWIPEIKPVRLGGHLIDEPEGQAIWAAYLQAGAKRPAELAPMLAQISAVVLFDLLIDNFDRWSGNNTQGSPDGRTLYFMDNTLSFSTLALGHAANLSKLYKIQVFPRSLVGKLRGLTAEAIAAAIGREDDLLGPLLTGDEIQAIIARRDHLIEYIDKLIGELGEAAVLALP